MGTVGRVLLGALDETGGRYNETKNPKKDIGGLITRRDTPISVQDRL